MKRKLIVALGAMAGLNMAFAQSNIQTYGVVDLGYAHFRANGTHMNAIDNGLNLPSRLGFKGVEDLGNGLKALFTLEYNIAPDQNSGIGDAASRTRYTGSQARQQLVGLSGGFGTVVAGRLQTTGFDFACSYNPVAGGVFNVSDRMKAATVLVCGSGGRRDNAVAYISPAFSGLTLAVNHARVTEDPTAQATGNDAYANLFSANYANGPVKVGAVYSKISAKNTVASDDTREYGLGGAYDFGVAKAFAMYQNQKVQGTESDSKWSVGVAVPVSNAGTVKAAYGKNKIHSGGLNNADSQAYSLVYNHDLSKRTQLYAGWTHIDTDKKGTLSLASDVTVGTDSKGSVIAMGLTHKF